MCLPYCVRIILKMYDTFISTCGINEYAYMRYIYELGYTQQDILSVLIHIFVYVYGYVHMGVRQAYILCTYIVSTYVYIFNDVDTFGGCEYFGVCFQCY